MADSKTRRGAAANGQEPLTEVGWTEYAPRAVYRCQVYLSPEEDGRISVGAATLPGVASQGRNEEEAIANILEALAGAIHVYHEAGESIPWAEEPRKPDHPKALIRWVVVHV